MLIADPRQKIWELDADIGICLAHGCNEDNYVEPRVHIQHRYCRVGHAVLHNSQKKAVLVIQRWWRKFLEERNDDY